jgi:hypothetical protein
MVKNEGRIIEHCLRNTLPYVDAALISDTESTDAAKQIARSRLELRSKPFHIEEVPWKDFGHNRTLTLTATKAFAQELGWVLEDSYCLALDADMEFRCPSLARFLSSMGNASGVLSQAGQRRPGILQHQTHATVGPLVLRGRDARVLGRRRLEPEAL